MRLLALAAVLLPLASAAQPVRPARTPAHHRPFYDALEALLRDARVHFERCRDEHCLEADQPQCRPALHLDVSIDPTHGTERLGAVVLSPLAADGRGNGPCRRTYLAYQTRDCTFERTHCLVSPTTVHDENGMCAGWGVETLPRCPGSPLSAAQRARNVARERRQEEDAVLTSTSPVLAAFYAGGSSRFAYSQLLPCVVRDTPKERLACEELGPSLFTVLEQGDACRSDSDCSVLSAPLPHEVCCVAVGPAARARLASERWRERLDATCTPAPASCAPCAWSRCVEGHCRLKAQGARVLRIDAQCPPSR